MYTRTRRPRIVAALVAALAVVVSGLTFAAPAAAVSDVQVTVLLPDGATPAANTLVYLYDNATTQYYDGTTDGVGVIQFVGVEPGSYEVGSPDAGSEYLWASDLVNVVDGTPTTATVTLRTKALVTGTVPLDAVDTTGDPTYASVLFDGGTGWQSYGRVEVGPSGSFAIPFPFESPATVTVLIEVPDTVAYADTYYGGVVDGASASTLVTGGVGTTSDAGEIDLIETWIIRGFAEDDLGTPVDGASVTATDSETGDEFTTTTAPDGTFRLDPTYTGVSTSFAIGATKAGHDVGIDSPGPTLDSTTRIADVTLDMDRLLPGVAGNGVYFLGGTLVPALFTTTLYKSDGWGATAPTFDPVPLDETSGAGFDFAALDDGLYRVGFTNELGYGIPWSTHYVNGSQITPTGPGGNCYIEFEMSAGQPDLILEDILFDSTVTRDSCEYQPWVAQDDSTFYGQLDNMSGYASEVRVGLFSIGDNRIVSEGLVNPTNAGFSLQLPHNQTELLLVVYTAGVDPYLSTVFGDNDKAWIGEPDSFDIDPFSVTPNMDYNVGMVDALPAHVFAGTVTSADGSAVAGACLFIEDVSDPDRYDCTESAADGSYAAKVPPGADWILSADGSAIGFSALFWEDQLDYADADPITSTAQRVDHGYNFVLQGDPASILLSVGEISTGDTDIIVHIYRPSGSTWVEHEAVRLTPTSGQVMLTETEFGTAPSALRFRFEVPGVGFVQLQGYLVANALGLTLDTSTLATTTCVIDTPVIRDGAPWIVTGGYDLADAGSCAAEPVPSAGTPGTTGTGTPRTGTTPAATEDVTPVPTSTPTPAPSPSASESAEPTDETVVDKPAAASGPDLAWLFWAAGVLVLLILAGGAVLIFRRR